MKKVKRVLLAGLETRKDSYIYEVKRLLLENGCEFELAKDYEEACDKLSSGTFDGVIIELFLKSNNSEIGKRALDFIGVSKPFKIEQGMQMTGVVLFQEYADKVRCVISQDTGKSSKPEFKPVNPANEWETIFTRRSKHLYYDHKRVWLETSCACCTVAGLFE